MISPFLLYLLLLAASLCWLWLSFLMLMKKRRERILKELQRTNQEASALMQFFSLTPDSDKRQLTKRYRLLAKEAHPDAKGSAQAFEELREKYERAVELLFGGGAGKA